MTDPIPEKIEPGATAIFTTLRFCSRPNRSRIRFVSRFWLTYCDRFGRLLGVVIQDSYTLLLARFRASVAEIDQGAAFCEGHELDAATAKLVPERAIGRMLDPVEAGELIRKIERQIPKRPPAPTVKRRVAGRKRA
jgi:hypothetical protein